MAVDVKKHRLVTGTIKPCVTVDWTLSTSTFGKEANTLAAKIEAEIKREGELAMKIT